MAQAMSAEASVGNERDHVLSLLEGRSCQHCDDGELEKGFHKGYLAALCAECEVPQVRFS